MTETTSETWKETYLAKLQESKKTGKSLSEICESDPVWMKSHAMFRDLNTKVELCK